jgi:uncharacterized protein (DUF924 family)
MSTSAEILDYWFGAPAKGEDEFKTKIRRWYGGGAQMDQEIRERFLSDVERAEAGLLDAWADEADPCLALILLMDQFTRNVYRGTPRAYSLDKKAQKVALGGYERGFDRSLGLEQRQFFMMPLVHAEDLATQEQAVRIMERLAEDAPPELRGGFQMGVKETRGHRDTIARFGRFPARNAILGRASTAEESAYLAARAGAAY